MLSEWPLTDTYIWYVQFTCPSTANYNSLTFFTSYSSTPTYNGTLGVAIYSNLTGQPGTPGGTRGELRSVARHSGCRRVRRSGQRFKVKHHRRLKQRSPEGKEVVFRILSPPCHLDGVGLFFGCVHLRCPWSQTRATQHPAG